MGDEAAQDWLDRYVDAWMSYDPDDVSGLFSEDVAYRWHPYGEPIVGRDAVVASWLGEIALGDASTRDASDTYEAEYSPVGVDGDTVVATGSSRYRERPGGPSSAGTRIASSCASTAKDARVHRVLSPPPMNGTIERSAQLGE